ncbi:Exonuclease RdgC [Desulfosarcina cetonica]|uniref:recombination-associated protein RdgC n=1 Tax=Desulfosarcina cetonica TaxID=90730 RepID=UPI0006CF826D|nr:recombination-associated protein RdgC [Desulfosarcina cetonica]VTR69030.1 Exonuclease RdgC [Desulfosarcina cetonica]
MGIFSSSVSITQYLVEGNLDEPIIENVAIGLKKQSIEEIDNESSDKAIGWTCFNDPFSTDFDRNPFLIGTHLVFSMRIDKKSIPAKIVQKHYAMEMKKRLEVSGRDFLSKTEKKEIKDHVIHVLNLRIPATPNSYDLIWNYEANRLWFFSNLKGANEELETLFSKSFKLKLIRLFPYSMASLASPLSDPEKDILTQLSPTRFTE